MKILLKNFGYAILTISLLANAFLIYNFFQDEPVLKEDNKTILTQNELQNILDDGYKVAVINQKVSDYLIQLESKNRNIKN